MDNICWRFRWWYCRFKRVVLEYFECFWSPRRCNRHPGNFQIVYRALTLSLTHCHSLTQSLSLSLTHSVTHCHSHSHSLSHSLTHSLSHSLSLTLNLSLTHSLCHSVTVTHSVSHSTHSLLTTFLEKVQSLLLVHKIIINLRAQQLY